MRQLNNLIFDRTDQDLINDTDKAYIDYADLNRVENACAYLAALFGISITTKTWTMGDYRTQAEMDRIQSNINTLRAYQSVGAPLPPIAYTSITEANTIEKLLYEIETTWLSVQAGMNSLAFVLGRKKLGNGVI